MENELYNKQITSRKDFVEFLKLLHKYYTSKPEDWENNNLESFLEALSDYAEDIPEYYKILNRTEALTLQTGRYLQTF